MATVSITLPPPLEALGLESARELKRERAIRPEEEVLSTGLTTWDRLLPGGLPSGELVEIVGSGTSGRFSCVLSLLAATSHRGEAVALIDVGDHLDPRTAECAGVDLDRLLWARPRRIEEALSAAEILVAGAFPLVVLDVGLPPLPGGRGRQIWWVRLARAVRRHRGALLVSSPYPVSSGTAACVFQMRASRFHWRGREASPRLLRGIDLRLERSKSRADPRPQADGLELSTDTERLLYGARPLRPGERSSTGDPQPAVVEPSDSGSSGTPKRPRPRIEARSHWGYRRPALLPETATRALAVDPRPDHGSRLRP